MLLLTRALSGNYVNFGVFALYEDRALDDALDVALRLAMAVPPEDVLAFPKVARGLVSPRQSSIWAAPRFHRRWRQPF